MSSMYNGNAGDLATICDLSLASGDPLFVWGPPGCGKSDILIQRAKMWLHGTTAIATEDSRVVPFFAMLHEPTDILGFPDADREHGVMTWLRPHMFVGSEPIVLILEEVPNCLPAMRNACTDLTLNPDRYLPKGSRVLLAGNKPEHKTGASPTPAALNNRCRHFDLLPSQSDWQVWALENGVNVHCIAYSAKNPSCIEGYPNLDYSLRAWSSARSFTRAANAVNIGLPKGLEVEVLAGDIGDEHGAQLASFLFGCANLPSVGECLRDPTGVILPDDRAEMFALAHNLANASTAGNLEQLTQVFLRMPNEIQAGAMVIVGTRDGGDSHHKLEESPVYSRWCIELAKRERTGQY